MADTEIRLEQPFAKIDDERRIFGGWAYQWRNAGGALVKDHSGDFIDTPEAEAALEDAFVDYALTNRSGDDQHEVFDASELVGWLPINDDVVKALGVPSDYHRRGVFVMYRAKDTEAGERLWADIKKGHKVMLSIVGSGVYEDA